MFYKNELKEINIGDHVIVEGNVHGLVICDFDKWECLKGYEDWLTKEQLVGGNTLSSGIMVKTEELGVLYYAEADDDIIPV